MEKAAGRILKGNDVKLEGCFRLDAGQGAPGSANQRNAGSVPAQARIIENHPEFAVIEVTCGCGVKTHIRCEFINAQSAEQGQKNNGENKNES
ncbi:MAG: hypothetical protein NTW93_06215 [Phycisphaerae bacterium]|nr:hypothetical protein [Phycisphaerae bacterium]